MPLSLPNLDDRTYDDLVAEALTMLPRYAPAWTNYNPSDPGVTLVELLAYFAELFIYRLNRVTSETKIRFLQLLCGAENPEKSRWAELSPGEIDDALRQAVANLRRPQRAVTVEEYDYLAREATAQNWDGCNVLRSRSFARRNLQELDDQLRQTDAPGHVSVVVLPEIDLTGSGLDALIAHVRDYLEPRKLLATRLHVVQPFYLWVTLTAKLHMRANAGAELQAQAPGNALNKVEEYFSRLPGGGPQGEGWPFGRSLYLSEVYEALERVEGVDYVDDVNVIALTTREQAIGERVHIGIEVGRSRIGVDSTLGAGTEEGRDRILRDSAGKLAGIELRPYELIRIASRAEDFSTGEYTAAFAPAAEQNPEVST